MTRASGTQSRLLREPARAAKRQAPDSLAMYVAEIMACCDRDPQRRAQHRRDKLLEFPEAIREEVRKWVNQRLTR